MIFMSPVLSRATYRDHFAWHLSICLCASSGSHTFVIHALVIPTRGVTIQEKRIAIFFHCIAIYCDVLFSLYFQ